jgi:hypothetical protein
VIVRRAAFRPVVHMSQDAKTQLGVFIEHLTLWDVIAEMRGYEVIVLEDFLQQHTHLLSPAGAWVGF